MDTIEISSRLRDTTYLILGYLGEENFSVGTGIAFNGRGDLLTAAHVVTGRFPIRDEDANNPQLVILAGRDSGGPFSRYAPVLLAPSVTLDKYFTQPLEIDLAVLRPVSPQSGRPFLTLANEVAPVGTKVLMAGFPDDMELPLAFDRLLDYRHPEVQAQRPQLEIVRHLLMIKSGMIGRCDKVCLSGSSSNLVLAGAVYWIDNTLHSGASGGPVVNSNAEIIGILTKRAITSVPFRDTPDLRVPSGSSIAVSSSFVLPLIE